MQRGSSHRHSLRVGRRKQWLSLADVSFLENVISVHKENLCAFTASGLIAVSNFFVPAHPLHVNSLMDILTSLVVFNCGRQKQKAYSYWS